MSEQERADKLSEAIDRLMADQYPTNNDPLLEIARQLSADQHLPSRAAQARFNMRVERWFAAEKLRPAWFKLLPLAASLALIIMVVAAYIGVRNQLTTTQPTIIPLATSTGTPTASMTETSTATATPSATVTASVTITPSATPTTSPTDSPTASRTNTATPPAPTRVPNTPVPTNPPVVVTSPPVPTDDHGGNQGPGHDGQGGNPTDDHHGQGGDSGSSGGSGSGGGSDDHGSGK